MREVKRIFDDYKENIVALKCYKHHQAETEDISLSRWFDVEKVQGGKVIKQDNKMAKRIDRSSTHITAIKRLKKEIEPVKKAMERVKLSSKSDYALLVMRYVKSYSVQVIAQRLNVSATTVRSRLVKAEKKFLKIYEKVLEVEKTE